MQSSSFALATVFAVAALAACAPGSHESTASAQTNAPHAVPSAPPLDPLARGEQLVSLGGCGHCHTPMRFDEKLGMPVPDMTRHLSGHPEGAAAPTAQPGTGDQAVIGSTFTSFRLPFGVVYARNLTPDPETGLGRWTKEQFVATMRTGHKQGTGRALLPPMPWENLAHQSTADLEAMFDYLRSVPAIKNVVPEPNVPPQVIEGIAKSYAAMKLAQK